MPSNVYDWDTHAIYFAVDGNAVGDYPTEWVLGGIDYRKEQHWVGTCNEN